jgi:hypothetical protein
MSNMYLYHIYRCSIYLWSINSVTEALFTTPEPSIWEKPRRWLWRKRSHTDTCTVPNTMLIKNWNDMKCPIGLHPTST